LADFLLFADSQRMLNGQRKFSITGGSL